MVTCFRGRQVLAVPLIVGFLLTGCAQEAPLAGGDASAPSTAGPAATPSEDVASATASEPSPTRRPLGMGLTELATRFTIDGVTGAVPDGFVDGHIREMYVYLGENRGEGSVNWLTVVAPFSTKIGPWGPEVTVGGPSELPAEVPPADLRQALEEGGVTVHEWGELRVDGATAPVVTVDGYFDLCGLNSCRYNDGEGRFYILIPYVNGTLVVEGRPMFDVVDNSPPQPEALGPFLDELQVWADTIDLP